MAAPVPKLPDMEPISPPAAAPIALPLRLRDAVVSPQPVMIRRARIEAIHNALISFSTELNELVL